MSFQCHENTAVQVATALVGWWEEGRWIHSATLSGP